jgi:hypothetical protein
VANHERIRNYIRRSEELRKLARCLKTDEGRRLLLATAEEYAALAAAVAIAHQTQEEAAETDPRQHAAHRRAVQRRPGRLLAL